MRIIFIGFLLFTYKVGAQPLADLYGKVNAVVVLIRTAEVSLTNDGTKQSFITAQGLGSGVMISADGQILTAAHVVQSAEFILVEFADGEQVGAKVISSFPIADVALLKLESAPKNSLFAKMADSDKVRIGEQVFVIGAPYGLDHSLSAGHISGRHIKKMVFNGFTFMEFFQTDASINQGNSGGPMFNMSGEVIGIVSYILSQSGGFQGLRFVATSNIATKLLLEEKFIWDGMDAIFINGLLASIFNVPQSGGLLV